MRALAQYAFNTIKVENGVAVIFILRNDFNYCSSKILGSICDISFVILPAFSGIPSIIATDINNGYVNAIPKLTRKLKTEKKFMR